MPTLRSVLLCPMTFFLSVILLKFQRYMKVLYEFQEELYLLNAININKKEKQVNTYIYRYRDETLVDFRESA